MLSLFALALLVGDGSAPCPGVTTIAVNGCLAADLDRADAVLNRYYDAAVRRVRTDDGDTVALGLVAAERVWLSYRDQECNAVFDRFRGGTIRTAVEIACRIRLTRLRTYVIWRNWLTYADSTPPLLPRPAVKDALADGRG